jgi:hypothetical protein
VLALVTLDGVAIRLERRPRLRLGRRRVPRVDDDCPLCDALAGTEAALTDDLVTLAEAGGLPAERYAASDGACLDHVGRAVARGAGRDSALLRDAGRRIEAVRGDLRDYLASFDHRATDRAGIEVDPGAWRRALALVGGGGRSRPDEASDHEADPPRRGVGSCPPDGPARRRGHPPIAPRDAAEIRDRTSTGRPCRRRYTRLSARPRRTSGPTSRSPYHVEASIGVASIAREDEQAVLAAADAAAVAERIVANIARVIHAPDEMLRLLVVTLIAEGHVILEDAPGVGKTMLAKVLSRSVDCSFSRLQFTPDLLPSDVTGVSSTTSRRTASTSGPGPSSRTCCWSTRSTAPRRRSRPPCSSACRSAR